MKCSKCGSENQDGRKFCSECGTKFEIKCPECGFLNLFDDKFCGGCGAKIIEKEKGSKITIPAMPADLSRKVDSAGKELKGSRRNVAVVFADISGFTAMSETMDPEDVTDRMNKVFQGLSDIIYKYEGYIDKFMGDCVMALFGAPIAHEDDPLRAVLSSIEMQAHMKEYPDLKLAVGINYGLVVAGGVGSNHKMEYTVMGDTVNLAQRLEAAAGGGTIFVSPDIYERTRKEIEYRELEPVKVKGKEKPVTPYQPISIRSRFSMRKIRELPIVGRDSEMSLLKGLFEKVMAGKGQVVSIMGEAGIGKSKLTYEFQLNISENSKSEIKILEGRCIDYLRESDYWSLKQILRVIIGISESDSKSEISEEIEAFIKSFKGESYHQIIPILKYLFSSEMTENETLQVEKLKAEDQYYIFNRFLIMILKKISETEPLVIIFDDLHWADGATMQFIEKLVNEITDSKIFLILLSRPELELEKFKEISHYRRIGLKALPAEQGLKLASEILKCDKIDDQLSNLLLKRSEGNPFYIEELASLLLNGEMIEIKKNIAKLKEGEISSIPAKLNDLIMAKVDRLNEDLKNILQNASVIGKEFSMKILDSIIEAGAELCAKLDMIEKKDFILKMNKAIEALLEKDEYAFKHIIIKDVVYDSVLKSERRKMHRFVGEAIEKLYKDNLDEYLDILILHFREGGDAEKLTTYLLRSGIKEEKYSHFEKSEKLYKEYIEIQGEKIFETKESIENYLKFVGLKKILAKYDEGMKILEEIEKKSKELLNGELLVEFLVSKSSMLQKLGKYDEAMELSRNAEDILSHIENLDEELQTNCFINIGNTYYYKGEYNKALEYYEKSLKIKLKIFGQEHPAVGPSYYNIGNVYLCKGEYKKALKFYEKSLDIWLKTYGPEHPDVAISYSGIGDVYNYKGEYDNALEYYEKSLKINLKTYGPEHPDVAECYNNIGFSYLCKGKFDKALEYHKKALELYLKTHGPEHPNVAASCACIGTVYLCKGKYDKALEYYEKSLKIKLKIFGQEHPAVATNYNNIGIVYKDKGEYDKALEYFEKSLEIWLKTLGLEHPAVATNYNNIGSVYNNKGEYDKALEYFEKSLEIWLKTLGLEHPDVAMSYHHHADCYLKLGKPNEAFGYIVKALKIRKEKLGEDNEETGASELLYAKILIELKRIPEAKEHLKNVIKHSEKLKKSPDHLAKARDILKTLEDK